MYASGMNRRVCLLIVPSCLLVLLVGCTRVREIPTGHQMVFAPSPQPTGGEAVVAIPALQTLFGPPLADASVQPGTLKLKGLVVQSRRLKVTALPSSHRTVALGLQEKVRGKERWGEVMIPQERKLFQLFAQDPSLGDWLIMITDVEVVDGPDPVPLVAYRWPRADVEAYSNCGIPQSLTIDHCTDTFYAAAQATFLHYKSVSAGQ